MMGFYSGEACVKVLYMFGNRAVALHVTSAVAAATRYISCYRRCNYGHCPTTYNVAAAMCLQKDVILTGESVIVVCLRHDQLVTTRSTIR